MKYAKIFVTLLLCSVVTFYSCNDNAKAPKEDTTTSESVEGKEAAAETKKATPPLKEPAQNALGVWHYTCRIGCPGGAGKADKCKTCGNVLAHNTVYHDNSNNATSAPFASPAKTPTPSTATKEPEPAQNAAGVWHYTCAKGCAGGSGSAGTCATCSGTLAHNSAYH